MDSRPTNLAFFGGLFASLIFASFVSAQETRFPGRQTAHVRPGEATSSDALANELAALRARVEYLESAESVVSGGGGDEVACPGWRLSAELLNWRLQRRDLDFAIPTDDGALAVGAGGVQHVDFGRDAGVRLGLARQTISGWEVGFVYTYFDTSATAQAVEPAGGNLWATRSHPSRNQEASTADAFSSFEYQVFDVEAAYAWDASCSARLRMFGGPRWARTDQQFRVDYDGRDFAEATVTHPVTMNAFGLRLGLGGEWRLGRGFSLFGRGAGSVMYGRFDAQTRETNMAGLQTIVAIQDEYRQAVPVLEAAVGLSWQRGGWELAAGYEIVDWFNLGDRSAFPNDVHEGLYAPSSADVVLEGVFARVAYTF